MNQESRKPSPSPEVLPGVFYLWAGPGFHCLAFHSFVYWLLLTKPLAFIFPGIAYYVVDATASIRMKGKVQAQLKPPLPKFPLGVQPAGAYFISKQRPHGYPD